MSHREKGIFIHPYLYFIVNSGMQFNHELLTSRGGSGERQADKNMLYVLATFEPTMKKNLAKQIKWLMDKVQLTPEEKERWETYCAIYEAWHDGHYFDMARASPRNPVRGKLGTDQTEQ